jgi:hypothetical protein
VSHDLQFAAPEGFSAGLTVPARTVPGSLAVDGRSLLVSIIAFRKAYYATNTRKNQLTASKN